MQKARNSFYGENDKREYVIECEKRFERSLDLAIERVISQNNKIITLSGPTCSRKTTTAKKLISEFEERGKCVHVISIDDFYYDKAFLEKIAKEENKPLDLDSPTTIDLPELSRVIEEIFVGDVVEVPVFDFQLSRRTGMRKFDPDDRDVFIFEGIQAVYFEVTRLFGAHPYSSLFVYLCDDIEIDSFLFDKNEVRFFRRLVRDYNFRGASPSFTFELWRSVRENEDKNIIPFYDDCTALINSTMPYELGMLKPYVVPLLSSIEKGSPYYDYAQKMIKRFEHIEEISKDYIPEVSLYHEFLG
jgi:uridine kinase